MSKEHATLNLWDSGNGLTVLCSIRHEVGPDDAIPGPLLTTDRASLANRITQVKNSLPPAATNIWAGLPDPLAAANGPVVALRFAECMERTISEGFSLFTDLGDFGLEPILKRLDKMPEGSRLTINTDCAFLPWEILYSQALSAEWPPQLKEKNPPDPKRLWGYRYIINYNLLDQEGDADWATMMAAHGKGAPFVSLNLNASIANAFTGKPFQPIAHHKDFYSQHLLVAKVGEINDSGKIILQQLYSDTQQATILYLYCHGRNSVPFSANNNEELEFDSTSRLAPPALRAYPNVYARAPIVFLNSCTSGQPSPLSFSSFHAVFRQKQAMGIIGTAIEIPATFGAAFGCRLLEKYLQGDPLGVAIYKLRRELVDKGNPLGLFYSLQCPAEVTAPGTSPAANPKE
jgi:hypothetical protein